MPLTLGWQDFCHAATKALKPLVDVEFDMLVASGISGQCVGFYTAVELKVPLLLIRKEPTKNGTYGVKRIYVDNGELLDFWQLHKKPPRVCFVDDWIGGGGTRQEVGQIVHQHGGDMLFEYLYAGAQGHTKARCDKMHPSVYNTFGEVAWLIGSRPRIAPKPKPVPARAPVRKRKTMSAGVAIR